MTTKRGIIRGIGGRGGLLSIAFDDPTTGVREVIHADNGPTVRALRAIVGPQIIGPGHRLLVDELLGLEFTYETDDLGLLVSIWA